MNDKELMAALKDMDNDTLMDNLEDLGGDRYYQELRSAIIAEIRKRLAVPEREKGEWIPVSERLPEDRGNYIIDYTNEFGEFVDISYFDKYGFWSSSNVIAWQPLPEPYKAESEE